MNYKFTVIAKTQNELPQKYKVKCHKNTKWHYFGDRTVAFILEKNV